MTRHPFTRPSVHSSAPSNSSNSQQHMSCVHSNFTAPPTPTRIQSHSLHISHRYSIAMTATFEPQTPLFLHCSLLLSLNRQLSGASGCYHAAGNQRYSHMSPIGVNSYYSGEGGFKGSENLLIRKDIAVTHSPAPTLAFSICWARAGYHLSTFAGQQYLTNNTNVIPLPSALCQYPS